MCLVAVVTLHHLPEGQFSVKQMGKGPHLYSSFQTCGHTKAIYNYYRLAFTHQRRWCHPCKVTASSGIEPATIRLPENNSLDYLLSLEVAYVKQRTRWQGRGALNYSCCLLSSWFGWRTAAPPAVSRINNAILAHLLACLLEHKTRAIISAWQCVPSRQFIGWTMGKKIILRPLFFICCLKM